MTPGRARSGRDPACSPIFIDVEQILRIQSIDVPLVIRLPGGFFTSIGTCNLIQSFARIENKRNHNIITQCQLSRKEIIDLLLPCKHSA